MCCIHAPALALILLILTACAGQPDEAGTAATTQAERPNVLLIMADDLGFSDLGAYGGEIRTPVIDRLADEGVRFTRFTNTGRCCPSRAVLLTGHNQFTAQMGWMTAVDEHRPAYRGQLTDQLPTIAEIFKDNGYRTYMSGKWHVTVDGNFKEVDALRPNGSWPTERGFDEFYGGLTGGGGYYEVKSLLRNETHITEFPDDYYYTTEITRHALEFIEGHDPKDPFFLYLAHYAPHRPMQAPEARIATYREQYSVGYDVLREQRFQRIQQKGLVSGAGSLPLHEIDYGEGRPSWESLSVGDQAAWIEEMATYAAMVEIMDDGIGEVIDSLKARGLYDNTIVLFLSDNGATKEGGLVSQLAASLSNTPFREFKQFTHSGGIKSPLIVSYPQRFAERNGAINHSLSHIMDILPTCLDIAGLDYPASFRGNVLSGTEGISLVPALQDQSLPTRDLFFEHQTSSAVVSGDWKLVRLSSDHAWELYHISVDPMETTDLAGEKPEIAAELEQKWTAWAEANNVFPLETRPWRERVQYYKAKYPDQDGID